VAEQSLDTLPAQVRAEIERTVRAGAMTGDDMGCSAPSYATQAA